MTNVTEILKTLISIPSVNPMGRDVRGDIFGESRLSDWLMSWFHSIGADCERISVSDGHDNVVARFNGNASKTLLLDVHQDTVPVDGMTIDPFGAVIRDGRMYGRGASDVKGSMAAMLAAFRRLVTERPPSAPNVVLSCTCDEESTATGIRHLVNCWTSADTPSRLLTSAPDAAIVAEPTELNAVIAHRGVLRFRVRTRGRAFHSSDPSQGINAVYRMAPLITRLQREAEELQTSGRSDQLCGRATLSVGVIRGGQSVNIVPDECEIEIDRRLIPGEDPDAVFDDLKQKLTAVDSETECDAPWISCHALSPANNAWLADRVLEQTAAVVGPRQAVAVPYCTNASAVSGAGVPTIVFGPGSISQAHTVDEFIELQQVEHAAEICFRACVNVFQ
ncbi:MAG: M20 family metallopeptidase [Planctomycetaceae bacterium]|nr:M20 family metallopeptidase [Planctomycetaceae bacterium]